MPARTLPPRPTDEVFNATSNRARFYDKLEDLLPGESAHVSYCGVTFEPDGTVWVSKTMWLLDRGGYKIWRTKDGSYHVRPGKQSHCVGTVRVHSDAVFPISGRHHIQVAIHRRRRVGFY